MNVREVETQTRYSPPLIAIFRMEMARELGLRPRTDKEMEDFKTGYYMDLNGNLAVVNSVIREDDGESIEFSGEIDTICEDNELVNEINKQSVRYWEYLGPL